MYVLCNSSFSSLKLIIWYIVYIKIWSYLLNIKCQQLSLRIFSEMFIFVVRGFQREGISEGWWFLSNFFTFSVKYLGLPECPLWEQPWVKSETIVFLFFWMENKFREIDWILHHSLSTKPPQCLKINFKDDFAVLLPPQCLLQDGNL